jgi:hypothetical protein
MKLTEIKKKSGQILYTSFVPPRVISFKTKKDGFPFLIVMSNDAALMNTTSVSLMKVFPTKLKKFLEKIFPAGVLLKDKEKFEIYSKFVNGIKRQMGPIQFEALKKMPDLFPVEIVEGREKIFLKLTTDYKLPTRLVTELFGEEPKQLEDTAQVMNFHGAKIIFSENFRQSRKEIIISLLQNVYKKLTAKHFEFLLKVVIRVLPMTGIAGSYSHDTKDLRINSASTDTKRMNFTIIHELAHKLYFEFLNEKQIALIKKKFEDLRAEKYHAKEYFEKELDDLNDTSDFIGKLKVGTIINYVGTSRTLKSIGQFTITKIGYNKITFSGGGRLYSGPFSAFHPDNWHIKGQPKNEKRVTDDHEYKLDTKSDSWFPTLYSTTNVEEWFAENFAFYILDNINNKEVTKWFSQFSR